MLATKTAGPPMMMVGIGGTSTFAISSYLEMLNENHFIVGVLLSFVVGMCGVAVHFFNGWKMRQETKRHNLEKEKIERAKIGLD